MGCLGVCLGRGQPDQSLLDLIDLVREIGQIEAGVELLQVAALGFEHDPGVFDPLGWGAWIVVAAHRFLFTAEVVSGDFLGRQEQVLARVH